MYIKGIQKLALAIWAASLMTGCNYESKEVDKVDETTVEPVTFNHSIALSLKTTDEPYTLDLLEGAENPSGNKIFVLSVNAKKFVPRQYQILVDDDNDPTTDEVAVVDPNNPDETAESEQNPLFSFSEEDTPNYIELTENNDQLLKKFLPTNSVKKYNEVITIDPQLWRSNLANPLVYLKQKYQYNYETGAYEGEQIPARLTLRFEVTYDNSSITKTKRDANLTIEGVANTVEELTIDGVADGEELLKGESVGVTINPTPVEATYPVVGVEIDKDSTGQAVLTAVQSDEEAVASNKFTLVATPDLPSDYSEDILVKFIAKDPTLEGTVISKEVTIHVVGSSGKPVNVQITNAEGEALEAASIDQVQDESQSNDTLVMKANVGFDEAFTGTYESDAVIWSTLPKPVRRLESGELDPEMLDEDGNYSGVILDVSDDGQTATINSKNNRQDIKVTVTTEVGKKTASLLVKVNQAADVFYMDAVVNDFEAGSLGNWETYNQEKEVAKDENGQPMPGTFIPNGSDYAVINDDPATVLDGHNDVMLKMQTPTGIPWAFVGVLHKFYDETDPTKIEARNDSEYLVDFNSEYPQLVLDPGTYRITYDINLDIKTGTPNPQLVFTRFWLWSSKKNQQEIELKKLLKTSNPKNNPIVTEVLGENIGLGMGKLTPTPDGAIRYSSDDIVITEDNQRIYQVALLFVHKKPGAQFDIQLDNIRFERQPDPES